MGVIQISGKPHWGTYAAQALRDIMANQQGREAEEREAKRREDELRLQAELQKDNAAWGAEQDQITAEKKMRTEAEFAAQARQDQMRAMEQALGFGGGDAGFDRQPSPFAPPFADQGFQPRAQPAGAPGPMSRPFTGGLSALQGPSGAEGAPPMATQPQAPAQEESSPARRVALALARLYAIGGKDLMNGLADKINQAETLSNEEQIEASRILAKVAPDANAELSAFTTMRGQDVTREGNRLSNQVGNRNAAVAEGNLGVARGNLGVNQGRLELDKSKAEAGAGGKTDAVTDRRLKQFQAALVQTGNIRKQLQNYTAAVKSGNPDKINTERLKLSAIIDGSTATIGRAMGEDRFTEQDAERYRNMLTPGLMWSTFDPDIAFQHLDQTEASLSSVRDAIMGGVTASPTGVGAAPPEAQVTTTPDGRKWRKRPDGSMEEVP